MEETAFEQLHGHSGQSKQPEAFEVPFFGHVSFPMTVLHEIVQIDYREATQQLQKLAGRFPSAILR